MNRNRPQNTDRAAQNAQTLKALVKLEGNKVCADCKRNKHPRWASWNLGVFVCIRCSGIHRGMGTHISRVKSVDLDAWTDEQLQSVLKWGNSRANKYWEAKLQPGHVPSDGKIENFIRTKYETKRWAMDGPMPDPSTLGDDDDVPLNVVQEKAKIERSASQRQSAAQSRGMPPPVQAPPQTTSVNLFDDFEPPVRPSTTDVSSTRQTSSIPPPIQQPQQPAQSLMGLDFLGSSSGAGIGRPASATGNATSTNSRGDLKNSILSLYASAPKPQAQVQPVHGRQPSFGGMGNSATPKQDAFGGLADAFGGLSFNTPTTTRSAAPPQPASIPSQITASPAYNRTNSNLTANPAPASMTIKSTPAAPQVTSPPPLSGGDFFSSTTTTKPLAAKPLGATTSSALLDFSFAAQPITTSPPASKPATSALPADLFNDDAFGGFATAASPPRPPVPSSAAAMPSPSLASPPANFSSPFNLSSPTMSAPVPKPSLAPTRPLDNSTGNSVLNPWGSADTDAWAAPAQQKPSAPKVELGSVPSKITPDDISGGWGAPISGPTANKSSIQPTVATDEDFGGWASASMAPGPANTTNKGFGGSDPFDNPWG